MDRITTDNFHILGVDCTAIYVDGNFVVTVPSDQEPQGFEIVADDKGNENLFFKVKSEIEPYWRCYRLNKPCPDCGSINIEREYYLNPCAYAACRLNGPVTCHLGCGSQYKEFCADCDAILFDSAQDEIDHAEWEEVRYICSQCEVDGIQPGHFACGTTLHVPV